MTEENFDPDPPRVDVDSEGNVVGETTPLNVTLSNKLYDVLKFVALVLLPALATLYIALAGFWDVPEPERVVATITVVDTFLGAVLGLSSKQYKGATQGALVGFLDVHHTPAGKRVELQFPGDPHDIDKHDKVTFKVRKVKD